MMARLCKKLGIKKGFPCPYHPQCDGMVERLKRTLLKDLRGYVDTDDKNWAELLLSSCLRDNTSRHSATGTTPFKATFGAEAFDWYTELGLREKFDDGKILDLSVRIRSLQEEIFRKSVATKTMGEKFYNKSVEERVYEVGDRVLVFDVEGTVAKGRKFRAPWLGPYVIVEKVTDINYVLQAEGNRAIARSHVNRLARLSERLVELQGVSDVFPDTRRNIRSILEWNEVQSVKQFKIRSRGRNGFSGSPSLIFLQWL
jgi:hypothetical protein